MTESDLETYKTLFKKRYPNAYYLEAKDKEGLKSFLLQKGWIKQEEEIKSVSKAGEGNMNCTLRVSTNARSFILKQSRPWVEKYPQIPAPATRALTEGQFYQLISSYAAVAERMPAFFGIDGDSNILFLEDFGESQDFTFLYSGQRLSESELTDLAHYLSSLHAVDSDETAKGQLENREMRTLNHEHIFNLPIQKNNGLELDKITPGLSEVANDLKEDKKYTDQVTKLGELYLANGPVLLHGDFFPGSWLKTKRGIKVIDPEFCFFGMVEFDLGVFFAHLYLSQKEDVVELQISTLIKIYKNNSFDLNLARRFAGVEIMRRLIGVAQLPLTCGLENKSRLLNLSRRLVLE